MKALLHACTCVVAGILAGCGQFQPQPETYDRTSSWVSPQAQSEDLLYVSDQLFSEVYVLSYPAGKPAGMLTGFNYPEGLCTDSRGDVFVTDLLARKIVEYAHAGSKPKRVLNDSKNPQGCSVNPLTGDLAVVDYGSSGTPGDVAVYPKARGSPTDYDDPTMISFQSCAYDGSGNLFADGQKYANEPGLVELPAGARKLKDIRLNHGFNASGSVQWDGQHLAVMGNAAQSIYRLTISGLSAKIVGRTKLISPKYPLAFWIEKNSLLLTYLPPHSKQTALGVWAYPSGGRPVRVRHLVGIYGVTVSSCSATCSR